MKPQICDLLSRLRIHSPDCERCGARETCGNDLLKRLQELKRRAQMASLQGGQGEGGEDPDSKQQRL